MMKKSKKSVFSILLTLILTLSLTLTIFGCGGGGSSTAAPANPVADYEPGDEVEVANDTICEAGGSLQGTICTPTEDVVVTIPAGALPEDVDVSLGYDTGTLTVIEGEAAGKTIVLNTPGVEEFSQPVEITVPYDNSSNVMPVPYYVDDDGNLHLARIKELDQVNGTVTLSTFHASIFTWILELIGIDSGGETFDTGFASGEDGFQIVNRGSTINREGECFGMTSFALWYYDNHKSSGNFYPRFMTEIGDSNLFGQNIIATRTFNSIAQQWSTYLPEVTRQQNLTEEQQMTVIRSALVNTSNPVLIYLYHDVNAGSGAHSVLATGYETDADPATQVDISIYDPNFPNTTRTIVYDVTNTGWDDYGTYDGIIYNGDGSLNLTEPYTFILDDAVASFHSSEDAVITVLPPYTNNQQVTSRTVTLTGTIESGQVAVTELKVFVNSVPFETQVGFGGYFSVDIPLQAGNNLITFETRGEDADGDLILINNNMTAEDFKLVGVFDDAAILVTLTWDKYDTDVDLYVIDPTGDYSCYYHMLTADGGELDIDMIFGYGPEHWTLTYLDTVRWDQDYTVRLHYFSDHDNGPTNYNVSIMLYEGTDRQTEVSFTGNLSYNDPLNDLPTDTGADWVNLATIRPTQVSGVPTFQIIKPKPVMVPQVFAPILPVEERAKLK
jgi:uncharacterized protein YfaP (DUF2135 family)